MVLVIEVLNRSARPVPIMEQLQTNFGLINELVNYDNIPDKPYKEVLKKIEVILTNHLARLQKFCNLPVNPIRTGLAVLVSF